MTNAMHSSSTNEHFTPPEVIASVRDTFGGQIDLDPASSQIANTIVDAGCIYTLANPGHNQPWHGKVFLNPPGGLIDDEWRPVLKKCRETGACGLPPGHEHMGIQSSAKAWWFKLVDEFESGRVEAAVFLGFNLELLQSTQTGKHVGDRPGLPLDFPFCIPRKRLPFWHMNAEGVLVPGTQPTHGNVIVGLLRTFTEWDRFKVAFSRIGRVRL